MRADGATGPCEGNRGGHVGNGGTSETQCTRYGGAVRRCGGEVLALRLGSRLHRPRGMDTPSAATRARGGGVPPVGRGLGGRLSGARTQLREEPAPCVAQPGPGAHPERRRARDPAALPVHKADVTLSVRAVPRASWPAAGATDSLDVPAALGRAVHAAPPQLLGTGGAPPAGRSYPVACILLRPALRKKLWWQS
jgi:hypothetical protein